MIRIIEERCSGCKRCLKVCPFSAIKMIGNLAYILDGCNLCGACRDVCPIDAIQIEGGLVRPKDIESNDILVFIEHHGKRLAGVGLELLGEGRRLANEVNGKVLAVILGDGVEGLSDEVISYGADRIYLGSYPLLKDFNADIYTQILVDLIRSIHPSIVLIGATDIGRLLAPRIAARLRTGLTADCIALSIDKDGSLIQTRPAFGGNIMAEIKTPLSRPQMVTVRPRVMKRPKMDPSRKGEVIEITPKIKEAEIRTRILEIIETPSRQVKLDEADIIVAGGRGLGNRRNFGLIEELAQVLGGVAAGSRPAVDNGWIPHTHQVGQTGKTVSSRLYIACGISGAIQHLVGIRSCECIVAINKDENAPIFDVATYGIVADLFEVLPRLIDELRSTLK